MTKTNSQQKKKILFRALYAALISLMIIACAISIAMISTKNKTSLDIGEDVAVSTNTYIVPMQNATIAKDYSATELQYNETLKQWEIHKAIDFVASENLDVYAIKNGTVSKVYTNYLEGSVVEISHGDGLVSVYKSLDNVLVKVGDSVVAGAVIASAGETMAEELSTGKHLHLELILNGTKVDPNNYLSLGDK